MKILESDHWTCIYSLLKFWVSSLRWGTQLLKTSLHVLTSWLSFVNWNQLRPQAMLIQASIANEVLHCPPLSSRILTHTSCKFMTTRVVTQRLDSNKRGVRSPVCSQTKHRWVTVMQNSNNTSHYGADGRVMYRKYFELTHRPAGNLDFWRSIKRSWNLDLKTI